MRDALGRTCWAVLALCLTFPAVAAQLVRFTPQGVMARVAQVQADFDAPVVALGDTAAADPYRITCDGGQAGGSGGWADPQHWVYRFEQPLSGAVSCQADPNPAFRDLQGQPLATLQPYTFSTGGPRATLAYPWGDQIVEDQVFVLSFNAPTEPQSVLDHAHCEVQGLGESVPVRLITGDARTQILKSIGWDGDARRAADTRMLQCKRRLPSNAQVRLVVGPGVQASTPPDQPPVLGRQVWAQDFRVREPFHTTLNCTRTHAQAPCSPLAAIRLDFSSPVLRDQAARIVLQTAQGDHQARELASADQATGNALSSLSFAPPFVESSTATLQVPADLKDDAGRVLVDASRFPLAVPVDALPPLVKFASGSFGIIERFADGPAAQPQTPAVPLALRRVGPRLHTQELTVSAGQVRDHVTTDDVQALRWLARVQRLQGGTLTAAQWADALDLRVPQDARQGDARIDVRSQSLFGPHDTVRTLELPGLPDVDGPEIEMLGVPVGSPGLHVIEIASPRLGAALLSRPGTPGGTMYVRSAVLVTNLAVHVKTGRDDVLVWVTSLDTGEPIADARVAVLDCRGVRLKAGETDVQGIWHSLGAVSAQQTCDDTGQSGVFVTARIPASHPAAHGMADFSFAWSSWNRGIEPWRFDLPFSRSATPTWVAHAVLDRSLLRVGETVSMKLFLRELTREGVRNPAGQCGPTAAQTGCLPGTVQVVHDGSGDAVDVPVTWHTTPSGGLYALLNYPVPQTAHLGRYSIHLAAPRSGRPADSWEPALEAGSFQVASFKLPVLTGSMKITQAVAQPPTHPPTPPAAVQRAAGLLVAPDVVQADLQLAWQSGGPAGDWPVSLSAMSEPLVPDFAGYGSFTFGVPGNFDQGDREGAPAADELRRLILDKRTVRLDAQGGVRVALQDLPRVQAPQTWRFEASFADPNGELQTISQTAQVWPADVVVGLQADRRMRRGETAAIKLVALDLAGEPRAGVPIRLDARTRTTYSTRRRLVGGFYAYDSHDEVKPLGTLCRGETDARGELACTFSLEQGGEVQFVAQAEDAQGRIARAATSLWVWGGESWFAGGSDDRIDVIPSQPAYRPGDTAEFTVRMPFRHAQALVAVEREGVLATHVVELDGDAPVIQLPVEHAWGPNVYVSVLAVRGRIRSVPWSSFLEWGWRRPLDWARARADQTADAPAPAGLVDLAKPSFRFGVAQIRVQDASDQLKVEVQADRAVYQVRDRANVSIRAFLPDGQPAAGAGVAFAAVDEALLDLKPNVSWDLLGAMRVARDYGVETASGQGQVVGRRHYGRKAVPAGGGGGFVATREFFDTLLLWRGDLTLDAQGRAQVQVPLNDSLTRFRLVAVVDQGQGRFGTGTTQITSTQDLQVVSGLPLEVREGDQYQARVTVRNRTAAAMPLMLRASVRQPDGTTYRLPAQSFDLAAGGARVVGWPVTAPPLSGTQDQATLHWTFEAQAQSGPGASDRIAVQQPLRPAVPVTVLQATLLQLSAGAPMRVPVAAPVGALQESGGALRGGIQVDLQSRLAGTLPGVRQWLAAYPYTCMEQLGARAVGMQEPAAWQALMARLPAYLADDGLVAYFPGGSGSIILTAELLEISARAQSLGWPYGLPSAARRRMLAALQDYVFGRLQVREWGPVEDLFWRKLVAVDALALSGAWQPGMLDSVARDVSGWPTPAVVTWFSILQQVPDIPARDALMQQADAVLRARLSRHGTLLTVSDATADQGWWLMSNVTTTQARLLMTALQRPQWRADVPRLLEGLLAQQRRGAWSTTTANVLGVLAVNQYGHTLEPQAGLGDVSVVLSDAPGRRPGAAAAPAAQVLHWAGLPEVEGVRRASLRLPWPASRQGTLRLSQEDPGSGWATVITRAAVPPTQLVDAGMRIERSVMPVSQARTGSWSVGDLYRVRLTVHTREPVVWAVISDPVPAGATILGSGLGRDSQIATRGESADLPDWNQPSFIERDAGVYRAYFEVMRAGRQVLEYTVRLNTSGDFNLPATRAEALYQPDIFGILPNVRFRVEP